MRIEPDASDLSPVVPGVDAEAGNDVRKVFVDNSRQASHGRIAVAARLRAGSEMTGLVVQERPEINDSVGRVAIRHPVDDRVEAIWRGPLTLRIAQGLQQP